MEIHKLFYTPLFSSNISLENKDVYPAISQTTFNGNDHMSVDTDVLNNTFKFLRVPICAFAGKVMHELGFDGFSVYSSWLTRTTNDNMPIQDHSHTNSFLSGVVYLHDGCSPLLLRSPMPWRWSSGKSNEITASGYLFEPKLGDVIIFPSNISHIITPMQEPVTRYSVAFNIIPTGIFGSRDSKINLIASN